MLVGLRMVQGILLTLGFKVLGLGFLRLWIYGQISAGTRVSGTALPSFRRLMADLTASAS